MIACELDIRAKSAEPSGAGKSAARRRWPRTTAPCERWCCWTASAQRDTLSEAYLRRAILVDPAEPGPWRMLAKLYRATRADQRLTQLETRHQVMFAAPLPR